MGGMKPKSSSSLRLTGVPSDFSSSSSLPVRLVAANRSRAAQAPVPVAPRNGRAASVTPLAPDNDTDLVTANAPAGTVRILLGLDVPLAALAEIEEGWSMVNHALAHDAEAVPGVVLAALDRLMDQAVGVSGVALAERLPNPLEKSLRRAA